MKVRALWAAAVMVTAIGCGGDKKQAGPEKVDEPSKQAEKAADEADKADEPAQKEPAEAKADEEKPAEAKVDEEPDEKPDEPAEPPAEFTVVQEPSLADIPAKALYGKVLGKDFAHPKVVVKYGSNDWSLEVSFSDDEHFVIPLKDAMEPPEAGHSVVRPRKCCPGFLHRREEAGKRPTSVNAPNAAAIEITAWDVKDYDPKGSMKQPGGKVAGRLAVVYDKDNWVAGTFETDFEYFGEPPLVRKAREDAEKAAAVEAMKAWKDLPAPEGIEVKPGALVWATSLRGDRWSFSRGRVDRVEDGLVMLAGDRVTVPGLLASPEPLEKVEAGAFVAGVDHLGPQFARVESVGDDGVKVKYLSPAARPRDNTLKPDKIFPFAEEPGGAGMPPMVFFDAESGRRGGQAVGVAGDDVVVLVYGGKELVKVPKAKVTVVAVGKKPLKKGAKVEALVGCGFNGWIPREGKVTAVLEGGIGYTVDTEACKNVNVAGNRVRKR